eukprot:CAMPEP_0185727514 /NCGR_PEP_ID=MMETSP1171-20130828/3180_1 /TAXON_ID=374046 /ORGANISM="Helicotheca tamensis, Strain CCMP826" /LENGTH=349 /DNA_ID=CAMNT_0028396097 /DNA_START=121 /DNA_END=1168 /DNA_ORIENTATION=+
MDILDSEAVYENILSTASKSSQDSVDKDKKRDKDVDSEIMSKGKGDKKDVYNEIVSKGKGDKKDEGKSSPILGYKIKEKEHKEDLNDTPQKTERDEKNRDDEKPASPTKGSSSTNSPFSFSFNTTDIDASCLKPNPKIKFKPGSLSKPILNMGFPDPGNKKLKEFFHCGGLNSNHQICTNKRIDIPSGKYFRYCGVCMRDAISDGLPPLKSCGDFDVFTHLSVEQPPDMCYWPQVEALNEIHKEYPDATFLLMFRDIDEWIKSLKRINQLNFRLTACNITGFPRGVGSSDDELKAFYCQHVRRIRDFVSKHPSHKLVEVDVGQRSAGKFMSNAFDKVVRAGKISVDELP